MFVFVFRSCPQHIQEATDFVPDFDLQVREPSSKAIISEMPQGEPSLLLPEFGPREENASHLIMRISHSGHKENVPAIEIGAGENLSNTVIVIGDDRGLISNVKPD